MLDGFADKPVYAPHRQTEGKTWTPVRISLADLLGVPPSISLPAV